MGRVGPLYPHAWPGQEIGWGLISRFTGKCYALEAAIACMDYAFDQLGWQHVNHSIAPDNVPTQVLAKRLGSEKLGPGELVPSPLGWARQTYGALPLIQKTQLQN